jgi:ketosteroid isomerase-like protein
VALSDVEIVREGYRAYAERDFPRMRELMHPDFILVLPEEGLNTGRIEGLDAWEKFAHGWSDAYAELVMEPRQIVDRGGGRFVVDIRITGTGAVSGAAVVSDQGHVIELREGKLVKMTIRPSFEDALAQL